MNNQDMQEQFKAEIIKNDYFLRVCRIKGIEPHEMLSLHTDGQFKYSDARLAYGAWLTKAFELQKKEKRIEELENSIKSIKQSFHKSISFEHDLFDKGWNRCAEGIVSDLEKALRVDHD